MNFITVKAKGRRTARWVPMFVAQSVAVTLCLAQTPSTLPSGVNPPPDDPEVYYSFFYFHDDFSGWLDRRIATSPARAPKLRQGAARLFGVQESELPRISSATRPVAASLRALSVELQAYVDQTRAKDQGPDRAVFRQFETRRQQIISSGIDQLRAALTPEGWTALHAYINGQYRRSVRQVKLPSTPAGH